MHLHILGIGGTFMSALALLAREAGYKVTGSDEHCYAPVNELLEEKKISWTEGYEDCSNALRADKVIVGNAMKRGMPVLEAVLNAGKIYTSGPQWLAENILPKKRVLAVSGTHGKTTTTSMLAFIFHKAGLQPGFLIGGVAPDFNTSAHLGQSGWFVIEADEYDSAFFDKRPKFMHYRPEIAILNNLEFDHADIYADLAAIQQQFHYFLRTIPGKGRVLKPGNDKNLNQVLEKGIYCPVEEFALSGKAAWRAELLHNSGQAFRVLYKEKPVAEINWGLIGLFNVENALAAFAASTYAGIKPSIIAEALEQFTPVKRRLEIKASGRGITIYDDFAHHPTAIAKTIEALKLSQRHKRILVALEFASYTMRSGFHAKAIGKALAGSDGAFLLNPDNFSLEAITHDWCFPYRIQNNATDIAQSLAAHAEEGDGILIMSNRSFSNLHQQLIEKLQFHNV